MRLVSVALLVFAILAIASTSADNTRVDPNLECKWKLFYKFLDVNDDDKISTGDVEESYDKLLDLHPEANVDRINFDRWWNTFILAGESEISEEKFVRNLSRGYRQHRTHFRQRMERCFTSMFDIADTNTDKWIDENEFEIFFHAFGHEDNEFNAYNPVDSRVPSRKMVKYWIAFAVDKSPSPEAETVNTVLQKDVSCHDD